MSKKKLAKTNDEFDRRFDDGEDIHDLVDISKARISHPGKKVRITLDVAEELVNEIDHLRAGIGVDRGALRGFKEKRNCVLADKGSLSILYRYNNTCGSFFITRSDCLSSADVCRG
ncbi:MAG: hypothetical protein JRI56_10980 [Deltaproteobacteria bacterium]|nr:hypothetical protein [Deltaproteobacteria bacterium]